MRRIRGGLVFFLLMAFFETVTPGIQSQASAPPIQISAQPGETPGTIVVPFEAGSDEATVTIYIGLSEGPKLQGVLLYGQLTDCEGRPLTVGHVELLQPDADAPLGELTLEPAVGQQRARLRISGLDTLYGELCGYLAAEIEGAHYGYNDLQIERPANPTLAIREADDQGQIQLVSHEPTLDEALSVSETGGKAGAEGIELSVTSLRAEGGESTTLTLEPTRFDLVANGSQLVQIRGTVPSVGKYTGLLQIRWGDQQQSYDLIVERQTGNQTVTLEAVAAVPRTRFPGLSTLLSLLPSPAQLPASLSGMPWLDRVLSYRGADVSIPIVLRETGGTTSEVYYPTLTALKLVAADGSETQAAFAGWFLRDCGGNRLTVEDPSGQPLTLTLASNATACMSVVISNLGEAGSYKATVLVSSPGGAGTSADVVVRLRDHWLLAALVIFLGALGSYGLRHWLEIGRTAQIAELPIARLEKQVQDRIADTGDLVRRALLDRLDALRQDLQIAAGTEVDTALEEMRTQLNDYLAVCVVLDLDLAAEVPDAQQRAEADEEIQNIRREIDPNNLSSLAKAKGRAEALRTKIDGWNKQHLREGIQKLLAAAQADLKRLDTLAVGEPEKAALKQRLDAILVNLTEAAGSVDGSYDKARELYEQQRAEYARAGVERLRLVLEGQPLPLGFADDQAWNKMRDDFLRKLKDAQNKKPEEMAPVVEEVRREYLTAMIGHLDAEAKTQVGQLKKQLGTEGQQQALKQVAVDLDAALQKLPVDPDGAEEAYRQARQKYLDQLPKETLGKMQDDQNRPLGGAPAQSPGAGIDPGGPAGRLVAQAQEVGAERAPDAIVRDILRKDRLALYIVSAVSVLVGLQALWVTNSTFGGLVDYIAVFLWGFGLHELNKVALPAAVQRLQLPWYPKT